MGRSMVLALAAGSLLLAGPWAEAGKIPAGYEVGEDSLSPDRRQGLLYPTTAGGDGDYPPNLLVRFAPYRVLAEIAPGLPRGVTTELSAEWSGNGLVALSHFRRWGLVGLRVYEIADGRVTKTHEVLDAVRAIFREDQRERLLKKFPGETGTIIFVSPEGEENPVRDFEFRGRMLRLNLRAENKPNLAPGPTWLADLTATWDLDAGKLTSVKLRRHPITIREEGGARE